jgi:tRNA threonylcarbamoyladenosine biosynthesis protein TsaE
VREELTVASADDMRALGRRLAAVLRPGDLVLLSGALGAGKTTLVQGIGAGLGVRGPVTSPTFVIARVHPSLTGGPALVHADAYRLTTPAEVDDLDLDASLETSVTVVEWGGGLAEGLAADRLEVSIALAAPAAGPEGHAGPGDPPSAAAPDQEPRTVRLQGHGARWDEPARATPADAGPADAPADATAADAGPADAPAGAAPAGATPAGATPAGGPPE